MKKQIIPAPPSVEELTNLAQSDFDQWLKLMVTGGAQLPFGSSTNYSTHPLRGYFEKHTTVSNSDKLLYTELMQLHAEKLGFMEGVPVAQEMMTVRERIVQVMSVGINAHMVERWRTANSIVDYMWLFIRESVSNLSFALSDVANDVAAGAPLYRLNDSGKHERVEDWEQPSAFLIGKATYQDISSMPHGLPAWAHGHCFRRADIDALPLFFTGDGSELTPAQFAARRAAYRSHIGLAASGPAAAQSLPNAAGSKLMLEVRGVRERYYGERFSLSESDTWPKQAAIVEWLKTDRKLSDREATAVDLVARPDEMRRK